MYACVTARDVARDSVERLARAATPADASRGNQTPPASTALAHSALIRLSLQSGALAHQFVPGTTLYRCYSIQYSILYCRKAYLLLYKSIDRICNTRVQYTVHPAAILIIRENSVQKYEY